MVTCATMTLFGVHAERAGQFGACSEGGHCDVGVADELLLPASPASLSFRAAQPQVAPLVVDEAFSPPVAARQQGAAWQRQMPDGISINTARITATPRNTAALRPVLGHQSSIGWRNYTTLVNVASIQLRRPAFLESTPKWV